MSSCMLNIYDSRVVSSANERNRKFSDIWLAIRKNSETARCNKKQVRFKTFSSKSDTKKHEMAVNFDSSRFAIF